MSAANASTHAKDTKTGTLVAYAIALLLIVALAGATVLFGLPGLAMVALTLVPVVYIVLLILTFGK